MCISRSWELRLKTKVDAAKLAVIACLTTLPLVPNNRHARKAMNFIIIEFHKTVSNCLVEARKRKEERSARSVAGYNRVQ